ncbi:MAG: metallophosphoesterase [Aureliella sp.]
MEDRDDCVQVGRRAFLQRGALVLGATSMAARAFGELPASHKLESKVAVGMVTDLHYAEKDPAGSRHYRETLGKLDEAAGHFVERKPDFVVELGDFIDAAASVDVERRYLKTVNTEFSKICKERHYVLGNHCVDTLTKSEFLEGVEKEKTFYSFDRNGFHFVVLDSCFRSDGKPYERRNFKWTDANIPDDELEWLKADLKANKNPVVVFAHQRLDVSNNHGVKNNAQVREILEQSGKVLAVFQGHSHKNDLNEIGGIHYCTLVAMVEGSGEASNGYSLMEIAADSTIRLTGFRKQESHNWSA